MTGRLVSGACGGRLLAAASSGRASQGRREGWRHCRSCSRPCSPSRTASTQELFPAFTPSSLCSDSMTGVASSLGDPWGRAENLAGILAQGPACLLCASEVNPHPPWFAFQRSTCSVHIQNQLSKLLAWVRAALRNRRVSSMPRGRN